MEEEVKTKIVFNLKNILIAFGFLALLLTGLTLIMIYSKDQTSQQNVQSTPSPTPGELKVEDEVVGKGAVAENGKKLTVNYIGTLTDGTKFDSSYDRGEPFTFTLGKGEIIKGWDQGLIGMKVDGERKLIIPPELAYGDQGAGSQIPPNSTLIFEIELLKVE